MKEEILNLVKVKPIIVPRYLFNNYKRLNMTEEEFVILIYLLDLGYEFMYNPLSISEELHIDKFKAMELINSLVEKKIISFEVKKNSQNQKEEYISLELLYSKLFNLLIERKEETNIDNADIFSVFEAEFGRTLSPMEMEIIKGWVNSNFSYELMLEALKEATYNGVNSLRYIDKILYEWKKKGLVTKEDIIKEKEKYHSSKKEKKDVFDYNWLEDE